MCAPGYRVLPLLELFKDSKTDGVLFGAACTVHLPSQETRRQTARAGTGMLGRFRVQTGRRVRCRMVGGWVGGFECAYGVLRWMCVDESGGGTGQKGQGCADWIFRANRGSPPQGAEKSSMRMMMAPALSWASYKNVSPGAVPSLHQIITKLPARPVSCPC